MSYVKKTTGGGQIDPPPAGIGLKTFQKNTIRQLPNLLKDTEKREKCSKYALLYSSGLFTDQYSLLNTR